MLVTRKIFSTCAETVRLSRRDDHDGAGIQRQRVVIGLVNAVAGMRDTDLVIVVLVRVNVAIHQQRLRPDRTVRGQLHLSLADRVPRNQGAPSLSGRCLRFTFAYRIHTSFYLKPSSRHSASGI